MSQKRRFEEDLAELEQLVAKLDADELPLEEAISHYEKGIRLSAKLNKTLEEAQHKVEILTRNASGEMQAEPFEEDAEA